ncbi:MAG TPA: hypothetical protein VH234_04195 [Candidatus Saccharimonadales bacterium]|jgi:hypothetical protein|nr:hypothetical protein [Candidatus Saccharimonadales bacterium]
MTKITYKINRSVDTVHQRRYRRRFRLASLLLGLIIAGVLVVFFDVGRQAQATNRPIGNTLHSTIAGPQTFRSAYFQFMSSDQWLYAPNDSTPNKLTYLLYQDGVPAHSITVYVNQVPLQGDLAVTRVLPVQIVGGNSFTLTGDISDTCGSLYKSTDLKRIKPVTLSGTNILCVPDSPQFTVIVGQVGADYNLMLKRNNGTTARYIIIYRNLSVTPDPTPFTRLIKTFQAV